MASYGYINNRKTVSVEGRTYYATQRVRDAVNRLETAERLLGAPATTFRNGRDSHEAARELAATAREALLGLELYFA